MLTVEKTKHKEKRGREWPFLVMPIDAGSKDIRYKTVVINYNS